jgi:hypothetical protein
MADIKAFEQNLLKRLVSLDKAILKGVSKKIVDLRKQGLRIDRIYVKGRPAYDRIIINGIVDPDFWKKFGSYGAHFNHFEVFPYGIVNPEGIGFKGTIGF